MGMADGADDGRPVVLFDGACRLCQRFVRFAGARDPEGRVRFVPAASEEGGRILESVGQARPEGCLHSVLFIVDGEAHERSTAALRTLGRLRAPWSWLSALRIVPRGVRDRVYDFVATRRYRWFGRADDGAGDAPVCRMPEK